MHTKGGDGDRLGIVLSRHGLTLHTTVVPERTLHTLLTLKTALRSHQTLHHFVVSQVTTSMVEEFLLFGLDTVEDRNGMIRCTVIVTPHQGLIVGIRTNHGNLLSILLQGQDITLILQQHNRLAGHIEGNLTMLLGVHDRIRNLRPFHQRGIIHLTQVKTALEQTDHVLIDLGFRDKTTFHGLRDATIGIAIAALHIRSGDGGFGRSMHRTGRRLMRLVEIGHGTTVADDEVLKAPLIAEDGLQQTLRNHSRDHHPDADRHTSPHAPSHPVPMS